MIKCNRFDTSFISIVTKIKITTFEYNVTKLTLTLYLVFDFIILVL